MLFGSEASVYNGVLCGAFQCRSVEHNYIRTVRTRYMLISVQLQRGDFNDVIRMVTQPYRMA